MSVYVQQLDEKARKTGAATLSTKYGMTCKVFDKADLLSHELWLECRKQGIGGSDVAAIMNRSPWESQLTLYRTKLSLSPDKEATEQMEMGSRIEGFIADITKEKLLEIDKDSRVVKCNYILEKSDDGFPALANVDRLVYLNGQWGILEIKNVIEYSRGSWDNAIPEYYIDQVMWYMYITGLRFAVVSALLGGREHKAHMIEYDEERVAKMIERTNKFWNENIVPAVMPEPTKEVDSAIIDEGIGIKEQYPATLELTEDLTLDILYTEFNTLRIQLKQMEERKKVLGVKIKKYMTDRNASKLVKEGAKALYLKFVKGRTKHDKKAFIANEPEAYETYKKYETQGEPSVQVVGQ